MNLKEFLTGVKETVITTSSIMLIVAAASSFAWVLTKERIPQHLTEFIVSTISNKYAFLLTINVFLLLVGMFIEGNAAMIVLVPLLAPVGAVYGFNEIHFAMVFIFNMAIGSLSPPMGTLMFVTCGITGCSFRTFIKEAVPYYIMLVIVLILLSVFPVLTTGLVSLVY
jgi:tripartite ATP-independent transporter DctM subunit